MGEWTSSKPSTLLLVPYSTSYVGDFTPSLSEPVLGCQKEPTRGRWARDAPTISRATIVVGRPKKVTKRSPYLVWKLVGRSQGRLWVSGPFLRRFASSGGPMDPHECASFAEKVSPWIDDVSSCPQCVFSPLFHLHTNIYQHL